MSKDVKRKKVNSFKNQKAIKVAEPALEVDDAITKTKRSQKGQSLSSGASVIDLDLTGHCRNAINDVKRSLLCGGVILALLIISYVLLR